MALILYSYRRCPFAIRVRMVLEEKRIPYQIKEENLSQLSTELLSLHPEGKVPLLVHEEEDRRKVIYQSSIITEYLEEALPSLPALIPSSPYDRAQMRLWTYWCDAIFKPDLDLFKCDFRSMSETESSELLLRLEKHLLHWDSALETDPFLLGSQLTLADIHLFPFARQFFGIRPPFPGFEKYSNLTNWLSRLVGRPAFDRVMAIQGDRK